MRGAVQSPGTIRTYRSYFAVCCARVLYLANKTFAGFAYSALTARGACNGIYPCQSRHKTQRAHASFIL